MPKALALTLAGAFLLVPSLAAQNRPMAPVELTQEEREAYIGSWRADFGSIIRIGMNDQGLFFVQSDRTEPLMALARDLLLMPGNGATMRASDYRDGQFHTLQVQQGDDAFGAERVAYPAAAEDFPGVEGNYRSGPSSDTWAIVTVEGILHLESPAGDSDPLISMGAARSHPGGFLMLTQFVGDEVLGFSMVPDGGQGQAFTLERVPSG